MTHIKRYLNLTVKAQDGTEVYFKVKQTTKLKKVMDAYCARVCKLTGSIIFLFEGDRITPDATPNKLGMKDEDEIVALIDRDQEVCSWAPLIFPVGRIERILTQEHLLRNDHHTLHTKRATTYAAVFLAVYGNIIDLFLESDQLKQIWSFFDRIHKSISRRVDAPDAAYFMWAVEYPRFCVLLLNIQTRTTKLQIIWWISSFLSLQCTNATLNDNT
eukprot:185784_1